MVVTTSRAPSARLREFAKEVRQLVPGAQRVNRGRVELPELVRACKANRLTDLLILHEHRGVPSAYYCFSELHTRTLGVLYSLLASLVEPSTE